MFDFVRKHTKVMMFLMFLLIIPAFVLVGVDGFKSLNGGGAAVAKVGSTSITQGDWDAAHKNEISRITASMPNIDVKLLESPEARYATLERLIRERVLAEAVKSEHLNTSDARLARELQQNPAIASLRKADGSLDIERYRQLAASQGLTPAGFEAQMRQNLSLRQVESAIVGTALPSPVLADIALNAFFENRDVQIARFTPSDFASKVVASDADLEAYYTANAGLFQAAETANVEYLVLDVDAIKKTISVNEADLKTYYEQNVARLSAKEERRASHILINAPKEMASADRQKAKERALEILAAVRKAPDTFAEQAKKNSQDQGSAAAGGDLDYFARGAMVKPFEDAAFAMKKGDISDVVESDFGFHIIKLTDIKTPKQRSYEELRPGLEAELKAKQAQAKFAELADLFTNGVYEQADSLKPIAERLKLEIKTATGVKRTAAPDATGVLANPKLLAALFNPDALEKKHNTEALEIAVNQLVSARVTQYSPARTLPFADVRASVKERFVAAKSTEMAKKEGADKLAAWKTSPASANLPASVMLSRDPAQPIKGALLEAVLRADTATLPAWVGVDLGSQGYAVARINKVLPRNPVPEATAKQEYAQHAQWLASAENQAYYNYLKAKFNVQVKVPRPSPVVNDLQASGQ
ncbi:SurA N-terminal domain-containing protein [Rhodoferax aquaticus]|uniref:Periplasmic chaperone PpiD n=1 Tax=Rhodoferax aquaticus TaxID=2527691 RepID=A0A515EN38_9BURK|nr:SurA N-terminal domain-containing protein [Rhodoferax aquaticus]QDL54080.1 peptidyl-prolyl cis-trans isomerase [Rhodoferax aquaticus]